MPLQILIVQHADKESMPGDPGLTETGHLQARACGVALARHASFHELWSSPLRRALETAGHLADARGVPSSAIGQDDRLSERMNWPGEPAQTRAEFRREWERATADREYQPAFGDSSRAVGDRFAAFLTELRDRLPDGRVIVVAHGGVTVDLVRTWFGDDLLNALAPGAIEHGLSACGITAITLDDEKRSLLCVDITPDRQDLLWGTTRSLVHQPESTPWWSAAADGDQAERTSPLAGSHSAGMRESSGKNSCLNSDPRVPYICHNVS